LEGVCVAGIDILGIRKNFGTTEVIPDLSLSIQDGEFVVFLGPSGCGKSTLLRMIAGLETVSGGDIRICGRSIVALPPGARDVAMVFQHYALYPHMTVRENMAFGLRNIRMADAEIERRVSEAARMLELQELLERKPMQMSGGQRQRVAISRAVVKEPGAFLFDEPLSNLDAALRSRTRVELARLHQRLKTTMIFVTHDQIEAMTLANRIVVMNKGRIEQVGTPMEVYHAPETRFVAGFIGSPVMNFLAGEVVGSASDNALATLRISADITLTTRIPLTALRPHGGITAGVRAEHLTIAADGPIQATADVIERLGERTLVHATLGDGRFVVAEAPRDGVVNPGDRVGLSYDPAHVHLFDESGRAYHAVRQNT
jgi:multiple sugar transport system ATP-binding protein